ncbi:hypothetical protein EK21DRAFT_117579 [Setomelanomma holmii]|uniref:Sorbitol dehydrogenase n=1 Tax=Setomelanomma holmii TaxID=210430 RepID=A0A9P4GZT6_9PLEO|nr:hypothetical protein EK21DRAFT_117579 [Setomelanomma holmii]
MSVTTEVSTAIQWRVRSAKHNTFFRQSTEDCNEVFVLSPDRPFSCEKRPIPQLRNSRDVRVRIIATGLCGSDIHYWQHGRIGKYVVDGAIVLGHESAGIVEACGDDVKGLQECCFQLPEHISFREGALVEPLSIAVHCCGLAGNVQGRTVAVFGAGPIGLLCCAVARAFGAAQVVIVEVAESRLEFATKFSADHTYKMQSQSPEANANDLLRNAGITSGADVVIDATGAEPCIECSVAVLKRGGVFVQAGLGSPRISFPIGQICDKEATLKGSFRYGPGDYKLAIELLNSKRICLEDLITHEYTFADAEKAFNNVAGRTGIKTSIYGPDVHKNGMS